MKENEDRRATTPSGVAPEDSRVPTGLPGLHTWRSVYLFVLACFAISVVLLVILTRTYR